MSQYNNITEVPNNILNHWYYYKKNKLEGMQGNCTFSINAMAKEITRRKEVTGTPLTTIEQLQFIIEHDSKYSEYDIQAIFKKHFDKAISKELVYVYIDNGKCPYLPKFEVNYNKSLEHNINALREILQSKNVPMSDFEVFCTHGSLFKELWFNRSDVKDQFKMSGQCSLSNLVHFIQYLVTGKLEQDYKLTNTFMSENNLPYSAYAYSYTIANISVKRFANGRLDIKGLTDKQNKTIDLLINTGKLLGVTR